MEIKANKNSNIMRLTTEETQILKGCHFLAHYVNILLLLLLSTTTTITIIIIIITLCLYVERDSTLDRRKRSLGIRHIPALSASDVVTSVECRMHHRIFTHCSGSGRQQCITGTKLLTLCLDKDVSQSPKGGFKNFKCGKLWTT